MGFGCKPKFIHHFGLIIFITFLTFSIVKSQEAAKALLSWKSTFKNQTRKSSPFSSWTNTNPKSNSLCTKWFGVSCNSRGSIVKLNLTNTGIQTHLKSFPFASLTNLTSLDLSNNHISGPIPPQIGKLSKIIYLDISTNQITNPIPSTLGNLKKLRFLHLHQNSLSGSIPPELGNLVFLITLKLNENNLTGPIPDSFARLTNLEFLYLRHNQLSGQIPQGVTSSLKLKVMGLDTNNFTGILPEGICKGRTLQNLTLRGNNFGGPIPKSLRDCKSLFRVRFEGNKFIGDLSQVFGVYPNLNYIDLSNNNFHGEISSKWGKSQNLVTLNFSGNQITGSIPQEIWNMTSLHLLDLSSNNITGKLPEIIRNLNRLLKLRLNGNDFFGEIPSGIGSLVDLELLDLSSNRFSSKIPKTMSFLSKLHYMNMSRNNLDDAIPVELTKLSQLSELDLSKNQLDGEIRMQISSLQSLETLDLSYNNLSGLIPSSFEEMKGLRSINISHNNLEGPIPQSLAFQNATKGSLEGNKRLCGNNLKQGLKPCSSNKISAKVVILWVFMSILGVVILVSIGVAIILQRRKPQIIETSSGYETRSSFMVFNFNGRLAYQEIMNATENFDAKYLIGEGGSGRVYKANVSRMILAVKKFHEVERSTSMVEQDEFLNEIRTLTKIRHHNIVKFFGYCSHRLHSFLVYQYLEKGSLRKALAEDEEAKRLDWKKRIKILKGVAQALSYMHHDQSPPIIHRDITSSNILLDNDYEPKVSDFGTAKSLKIDASSWSGVAGTYGYMAPELAYSVKATEKCDVYSFGVLSLEVIRGFHPGDLLSNSRFSWSINGGIEVIDIADRRLSSPSLGIKEKLCRIIEIAVKCVHVHPNSRPTMLWVSKELW